MPSLDTIVNATSARAPQVLRQLLLRVNSCSQHWILFFMLLISILPTSAEAFLPQRRLAPRRSQRRPFASKAELKSAVEEHVECENPTENPRPKKVAKTTEKKTEKKTAKEGKPEIVTERDTVPRAADVAKTDFKIISWNVDGLRAKLRLDGLTKIVNAEQPDLLVIQETKIQAKDLSPWLNCLPGYDSYWSCSTAKKGYAGTAAFVRRSADKAKPLVEGENAGTRVQFGDAASVNKDGASGKGQSSMTSFFKGDKKTTKAKAANKAAAAPPPSAIEVTPSLHTALRVRFGTGNELSDSEGRSITVEYKDFAVLALYVINSGQNLERLDYRVQTWDPHLRQYVVEAEKAMGGKPMIVTGDLNVAHRNIDIYNYFAPHVKKTPGCTEAERDSFSEWLQTSGRVDAMRALYGEVKGQYTYWSTRTGARAPNKGLRLDYFICPKEFLPSSAAAVSKDGEATTSPKGEDEGVRTTPLVRECFQMLDGFGGGATASQMTPSDHCPVGLTLKLR